MTYEIVFVAGFLSFFAPCIIPLLPVYVAQLSQGAAGNDGSARVKITSQFSINLRLMGQTALFVAGISTSFVLLGFGAGVLGKLLISREFLIVCGMVVILFGIHQMGLLRLGFLDREKRIQLKASSGVGILSSYLMGFTFSFGWTPCVGPVLAAVLGVASSQGQPINAALLMLVYSAGLATPFMIVSMMGDLLVERMRGIHPHLEKIQKASGVLLIVMGMLLMTDNLNIFSAFLER